MQVIFWSPEHALALYQATIHEFLQLAQVVFEALKMLHGERQYTKFITKRMACFELTFSTDGREP